MDCSICFLSLVLLVAVAHATSTPQDYWRTTLPNTPMPDAIRDLFRPDVGVGAEAMANTHFNPASVTVILKYNNPTQQSSSEKAIVPNAAVFFLEKDLRQHNRKLRLDFTRRAPAMAFLPRQAANAIPFSSRKLPTILNLFSIQPNSVVAKLMNQTLWGCEDKDPSEKSKHCATSLESMVDFAISTLGTNDVRIASLEIEKGGAGSQEYIVQQSPHMQEIVGENYVACHPELWPHAIFYCHLTPATKVYMVALAGQDGTRVNAVAVCHMDTSKWSPKHLAFKVTKVKPGTVPICHFLPQGDIVWAPKTKGTRIP